MTEKDLLKLKKDIDEAQTNLSKLQGSKQVLMDQLNEAWGCTTTEEAEKKLALMKKKNETMIKQIEIGMQEIEDKYINVTEEE
jgi:outer membrane protein TolC